MKILGIIPARAGSKGLPGKNTKALLGSSLIERAFATAKSASCLDRIVLSSNDAEAIRIARQCGLEIPVERPAHLSTDDSAMLPVVEHMLAELGRQNYQPDAVMLLQPTSPLRSAAHIQAAVAALTEKYSSVCSVVALPRVHSPYYVMKVREDGCLDYFLPQGAAITRRQDAPPAYVRDGTVYLTRVRTLVDEHSFYGSCCRPLILNEGESLSIDTPADWQEAECRLSARTST